MALSALLWVFSGVIAGIFLGVSISSIIAVLILPIFVAIICRMNGSKYDTWMLPKNFGVSPKDEISVEIKTQKGVMRFSQRAWKFCADKGLPGRITYLTSLLAFVLLYS